MLSRNKVREAESAAKARSGEPAVILLVEDRDDDVRLFEAALEDARLAADVRVVADGAAALNYLRAPENPKPDLIFLDIHTPKKSGFAVLSALRQNKNLSRTPVVVMTGSDVDASVLKLYDLRADSCIAKPIRPEQFIKLAQTTAGLGLSLVRRSPGNR